MKYLRYVLICMISIYAAASCNEKKEAMEPEEVVEAFTRAVAAGDFSAARALCDTVSMKGYLDHYQDVMNSLQKEDSCVLEIASSILAGAEFEVLDMEKKNNERTVLHRLAVQGSEKTRRAVLKKEEGEWKVTEITDAI